MNIYALTLALTLLLGNTTRAAVVDLIPDDTAHAAPAPSAPTASDLAVMPRQHIVTPLSHLPELPEPDVFAMMLVGLVLIGYRARRDSSETFK